MFYLNECKFLDKDMYYIFTNEDIPKSATVLTDKDINSDLFLKKLNSVDFFKNENKLQDISEISIFKQYKADYQMNNDMIVTNSDMYEMMLMLTDIEKTPPFQHEMNENYVLIYYPTLMIYSTETKSVKIPKQYLYRDTTSSWDYDYLIYPSGELNFELLDILKKAYKEVFNKELKVFIDTLDIKSYGQFSPNVYELLRQEYINHSVKVKAIINAIRVGEYNNKVDSRYYDIFQESRMANNEKMDYTYIKYKGFFTKEITINEYAKQNGYTMEDLNHIAHIEETREKFLSKYGDIESNPLALYVGCLNENPAKVMRMYEKYEGERCKIRRKLFMMNFAILNDLETIHDKINLVKSQWGEIYTPSEITWTMGSTRKNNSFPVTLEIKRKKIKQEGTNE